MEHLSDPQKKHLGLPLSMWNVIGTIAAVVLALAAVIRLPAPHFERGAQSNLVILSPSGGFVPRCASVNGTGTAPSGGAVWLTQQKVGVERFNAIVQTSADPANPDKWYGKITLGAEQEAGSRFTIYAFAMDSRSTELLESIQAQPQQAYLSLRRLPPHDGPVAQTTVLTDIKNNSGC
jgi:hypothetical protein